MARTSRSSWMPKTEDYFEGIALLEKMYLLQMAYFKKAYIHGERDVRPTNNLFGEIQILLLLAFNILFNYAIKK